MTSVKNLKIDKNKFEEAILVLLGEGEVLTHYSRKFENCWGKRFQLYYVQLLKHCFSCGNQFYRSFYTSKQFQL